TDLSGGVATVSTPRGCRSSKGRDEVLSGVVRPISREGRYEKVSDGFSPGAHVPSRACSARSRVARAFRRSDACLRRCRPRVLVGSVLVALPAAVLRVPSAAGRHPGAPGLHTAGTATHPGDAVVLVLLRKRQGLLPDRPGVS